MQLRLLKYQEKWITHEKDIIYPQHCGGDIFRTEL